MALTSQDINRVANLARLELRPDETERVLGQLNGFFALVAQMDAVNTDGVEPLAHPAAVLGQVALRLREDIVSEPNQREASQVSAPAVERGLFLVPKVIEGAHLARGPALRGSTQREFDPLPTPQTYQACTLSGRQLNDEHRSA